MGKIPRESKGLVVWEYSGLGSVKISAVSPWSARTIGCLLCCWKIRHSDISRWSLCRQGCFRSIAIQWCNHRRCKLTVHECAMYAKFHSMAGRTFYSSCRSGRSFQKAECTVEDRQQPETAAVSPFSRASSSLFFRRSSLLSSILGWKHESHDCWLPISSHCFHAFMLSTHCTLDSSEPRMRCSFPALKIVGDVVSLSRSCSNSWSQMIQVQRPASLAFIPGAGSSILSTSLSSSGAERRLLAISKFLNAALRVSFQRRASCPLIHKMPLAHKR